MKLKTESGEILELVEGTYKSVDADLELTVEEAESMLEDGKLEAIAEEDEVVSESEEIVEDEIEEAKKKEEVAEDEDEDEEDEEEEEEEEVEVKSKKQETKEEVEDEISVDVSEDVDALFNGEELSEDFRTKATTIFEAAVKSHVKDEAKKIEESVEAKIEERMETFSEEMTDKLDGYLDYVVTEWMEENKLAVESGLKTEVTEEFIDGLKGLFEDHYIDIPEDKYDVIGEQASKIEDLESKLDEEVNSKIEMSKEISEMKKSSLFTEATSELTSTQVEKIRSLSEEIEFKTEDDYKEAVATLVENYFPSEDKKAEIVEETTGSKKTESGEMDAILAAISKFS